VGSQWLWHNRRMSGSLLETYNHIGRQMLLQHLTLLLHEAILIYIFALFIYIVSDLPIIYYSFPLYPVTVTREHFHCPKQVKVGSDIIMENDNRHVHL
jgi:hypothetical protein